MPAYFILRNFADSGVIHSTDHAVNLRILQGQQPTTHKQKRKNMKTLYMMRKRACKAWPRSRPAGSIPSWERKHFR
uniref:Uncharacterized protein n=1 Tax=Arundo donax TaxID=35708 RepID=A0A0A9QSI2_ARUDO